MRFKHIHINNIPAFFEMIDQCTGKVELVGEGLRLNLKSELAQYVSLEEIFSSGEEIPELDLVAYNQEDAKRIIKYMSENH